MIDESWVVVDDLVMWEKGGDEIDESVLNPMSSGARSMNNFIHRIRRLIPKGGKQKLQEERYM